MFKKIAEFFTGKKPETAPEAPYKVDASPVEAPAAEAVVVVPAAVVPAAVVEQVPAWHTAPAEGSKLAENSLDVNHDGKVNLQDVKEMIKPKKEPKPKKQQFAKKEQAPKPAAPKPRGRKPKAQ